MDVRHLTAGRHPPPGPEALEALLVEDGGDGGVLGAGLLLEGVAVEHVLETAGAEVFFFFFFFFVVVVVIVVWSCVVAPARS